MQYSKVKREERLFLDAPASYCNELSLTDDVAVDRARCIRS